MMSLSYLRVLIFATLVLWSAGCEKKESDPQPTQPVPTEPVLGVATPPKMHTVAVRYYLKALSSTSQLPVVSPDIAVDYERVVPQGLSGYMLLYPSVQHYEQEVTYALKEVQLPCIITYANAIKPKIIVTIDKGVAPAPGSEISYQVICELLVDGRLAGTTTYVSAAGLNTPLFVTTETEVSH